MYCVKYTSTAATVGHTIVAIFLYFMQHSFPIHIISTLQLLTASYPGCNVYRNIHVGISKYVARIWYRAGGPEQRRWRRRWTYTTRHGIVPISFVDCRRHLVDRYIRTNVHLGVSKISGSSVNHVCLRGSRAIKALR